MWFDTWGDLARVLLVGSTAYVTLLVLLRVLGKRTLAKLNAFDLVVTVALGSTLATILLNADVSWAEGALALALLGGLQLAVSSVTVRVDRARSVVTSRPRLVLRDGEPDHEALRAQRLTLDELRQAVRSSGAGGLDQVAAVVLESDGSLSVITDQGDGRAMEGVQGWGPHLP
ncbi:DUF421 domain-containing protein [Cellulomonas bogoriensis]|uniref:Membrane protein n=1 Tax=Cellulomonas bogoriensis 69B4 = DSM 16987 TaxID=1386082 RepID=A0A0A0C1F7_9CELL|nr:YetF domain-containing protein [Cellulomonas bogoriensis]KGM14051.1 membrane protein [Cellulomonas bogoriensis 69B4 = DSM 16987]